MKTRSLFLASVAAIGLYLFMSSVFIVDQISQAIVSQFGEFKKAHTTPGLKFKVPFIQDVSFYEKRSTNYISDVIKVTTVDQKRLNVDAYVLYRIVDALKFYRTVQPSNEIGTNTRLDAMVPSSIKNVLGKIPLRDLLSPKRVAIMKQIQAEIATLSKPLGLEIVDVRIVRTELPEENRASVFERFNQTLIRTAKGNRADGEEKSKGIKASADRERVILLAEAQQKAQGIRGSGDAKAMHITNTAFQVDPEFYAFYRSLESYKETITEQTDFYLSADHPYFKYFSPILKTHK